MKILVTGGAGFIGSHLVDQLIEKGYQVKVIDNLSTGSKENLNKEAEFFNLDIREFEKIDPVFRDVDYVFHLAAIPRVPISVEDPINTSHVNILGTVNVFKAALNCKRVVFASSSSVYGNQKTLPLREEMIPNPLSPYGLQKQVGEQFASMFTELYNLPVVCLRFFNVYGPRVDFDSDYSLVLGKFLKQYSQGNSLTVYGDGEQTRGFCFVKDVVKANIQAMLSEKIKGGEVINVGSERSVSINRLTKLIGGKVDYLPPRKGDPLHTKADITLAKELLDWSPKVDFEEGVQKTKEWFNKNYE